MKNTNLTSIVALIVLLTMTCVLKLRAGNPDVCIVCYDSSSNAVDQHYVSPYCTDQYKHECGIDQVPSGNSAASGYEAATSCP